MSDERANLANIRQQAFANKPNKIDDSKIG